MIAWVRNHSLSLIVLGIWLSLLLISWVWGDATGFGDWFVSRAEGHSDDAFGALLIILCSKWFLERGKNPSSASK